MIEAAAAGWIPDFYEEEDEFFLTNWIDDWKTKREMKKLSETPMGKMAPLGVSSIPVNEQREIKTRPAPPNRSFIEKMNPLEFLGFPTGSKPPIELEVPEDVRNTIDNARNAANNIGQENQDKGGSKFSLGFGPKPMSKTGIILLVAGTALLLGGAGYMLYRSQQAKVPVPAG